MSWIVGFVCRQRLCINFSVSRVDFLTTLRSHLNVSCCFWSSLFNVDVNCSYILSLYCSGYLECIEKNLVNYTYLDNCWLFKCWVIKWVAIVLGLYLRRRCTKSKNGLVIGIVNSHGLAWAKWTSIIIVLHNRGQSLTVLPFSCYDCYPGRGEWTTSRKNLAACHPPPCIG